MAVAVGETSTTRLIWKWGRPVTTALLYSAILRLRDIIAFISGSADGIHGADSDAAAAANTFVVVNGVALPSVMEGASWAQILIQRPQPMQFSCST